jgi:hypothetical protein
MNIAELMQPKPLDYYRGLTERSGHADISLNSDQSAAILKAHDHGIAAMGAEEIKLLDQVVSKIKSEIWP